MDDFELDRFVAAQDAGSAEDILGQLDAIKLRSSMTLFHRAEPDQPVFAAMLERYFDSAPDPATDRLLTP